MDAHTLYLSTIGLYHNQLATNKNENSITYNLK